MAKPTEPTQQAMWRTLTGVLKPGPPDGWSTSLLNTPLSRSTTGFKLAHHIAREHQAKRLKPES